jgi:hypothetical protein
VCAKQRGGIRRHASQRFCILFTELLKVDKLTTARPWRRFRKKLARLLKDAVRLGELRHTLDPLRYERRKAKLHRRLDRFIAIPWVDPHAKRLIKRLRRHRHEMPTFLDHLGVSPYNNHAEQQMRVAVHNARSANRYRSIQGAKTHAVLLSHFRTADLQKHLGKVVEEVFGSVAKVSKLPVQEVMCNIEEIDGAELKQGTQEAIKKIANATNLDTAQITGIFKAHRVAGINDIVNRLHEQSRANRSTF